MSGIRQQYIQNILSQMGETKPREEDLLFLNTLTLHELAYIADGNVRVPEETMTIEEMLDYQPRNVQKDMHDYFVSYYTKKGRREETVKGEDEDDVKSKLWVLHPDAYRISNVEEIV